MHSDDVERELLGGERRWTPSDVSRLTGVSPDRARALWRAMGFATVDDDELYFTDSDVEALRAVTGLVDDGIVAPEMQVAMTRALGRSLSRLAEWQVAVLTRELVERGIEPGTPDALAITHDLTPLLERLMGYVWRRHLAAAAVRALDSGTDELVARSAVVGFCDLVGFTRVTRQVDEDELGDLVERFEAVSSDLVAERHGRVVKTLGDEILFVTDDPVEGAETGLALAERLEAEGLPPVRVGLAYGAVLARLGDVYGAVVNTASRLTSIARPGSVLVDEGLADALAGDKAFSLKPLRPRPVRGIPRLVPAVLRHADAG